MLTQRFELGNVDFFDVGEMGDLCVADDHLLGDTPAHADHLNLGRVGAVRPAMRRRKRCGRDFASQMHVDVAMRDASVWAAAVYVLQIDMQLSGTPPHGGAGLWMTAVAQTVCGR